MRNAGQKRGGIPMPANSLVAAQTCGWRPGTEGAAQIPLGHFLVAALPSAISFLGGQTHCPFVRSGDPALLLELGARGTCGLMSG
eukprot:scaffold36170_cov62-Isochrysis_galbana.AAC.1